MSLKPQVVIPIVGLILALSLFGFLKIKSAASSVPISPLPSPTPGLIDDRAIPEPPAEINLPSPSPLSPNLSQAQQLNVLLLGYGGPGHQGGYLTDVILVARLDFAAKKLKLIHIPRDVWVNGAKINAALPMGLKSGNYPTSDLGKDKIIQGSYLTKQAVNQVTGIQPDVVIAIDFSRFAQAINSLRGIEVQVLKTLDDPWYPVTGRELELCGKTPEEVTQLSNTLSGFELEKQFPCRYEHLEFNPGTVHMDGDTVLKFVRSRHTTSDFDRGERQIQVLLAIQDKLFSLKALEHIPQFFSTLTKAVKTDLTLDLVQNLAPKLIHLQSFTVTKISLSTANVLSSIKTSTGASALTSKDGDGNWIGVHQYVNN